MYIGSILCSLLCILCMCTVYGRYTIIHVDTIYIHLFVHPSIHACVLCIYTINMLGMYLCMCTMHWYHIYHVYVYYVNLSVHPFMHPSVLPFVCPCVSCVYTMYVYSVLSRYPTVYVYCAYGVYTLWIVCMLLYIYLSVRLSLHPSLCLSILPSMHVCFVCILYIILSGPVLDIGSMGASF